MEVQDVRRADGSRRSVADLVDDLVSGRDVPPISLQPIVNLQGPRIAGYEALARLDPTGWIGPDREIAEAWDLGVGAELETRCALAALERRGGAAQRAPSRDQRESPHARATCLPGRRAALLAPGLGHRAH